MRQSGMSEADIQTILEGLIPPEGSEEPYSPYEVTPVEASPEQLKEELKASLQDSGLPPEALDQAAEGLMLQLNRQVQRPIFPRIPPVQ